VQITFLREELLTLIMLVIMNGLILATGNLVPAGRYFLLNLALMLLIIFVAYRPPRWMWVRDWYVMLFLLVIFLRRGHLSPLLIPRNGMRRLS